MPFLCLLPPWDAKHSSGSVNQPQAPAYLWSSVLPLGTLPPLVHSASWDGICLPLLLLPHLTLIPFKHCLQPPCSPLQAFQPGALNLFHILPCTLVSLHPCSPTPADWGRPHCKHGAENITAGGFLQCGPNKTQTLPNNCYLQLK